MLYIDTRETLLSILSNREIKPLQEVNSLYYVSPNLKWNSAEEVLTFG